MCKCGKVNHLTMKSARDHADRLKEQFGVRPQLYACPEETGAIHVGYTPQQHSMMDKRDRRTHRQVRANRRGKLAKRGAPKWQRGRQESW